MMALSLICSGLILKKEVSVGGLVAVVLVIFLILKL